MKPALKIKFEQTPSPVTDAVTKFGGQPVWLEEPQWPISAALGEPMQFICQIKLTDDVFPGCAGKMAYIFMTDDKEDVADGTWEPDGGENAVIIQPGGIPQVPVKNITQGASPLPSVNFDEQETLEFAVRTTASEDAEFMSESQLFEAGEEVFGAYYDALDYNKIGGTPGFMQGDEFPDEEQNWQLLLQLLSYDVPFFVNFGDAGIGYAFINEDATIGKFLWQCS